VVFGRGSVVEDPKEAEAALVLVMEKYAPHLKAGEDYRPVAPEEVERTAVLRVDIESWSGKEKKRPWTSPGLIA
jgi:nitroimidazol reductase NimA-like FMN-containing flavoprotein (pyridoxamine 5'-phosphate oxidase superfamily)